MKKILILLLTVFSTAMWAQSIENDDVRQAVYGALDQAKAALAAAPFQGKTVAILPIGGDSGALLAGRLKNMLTQLGFACVEGKDDPMCEQILKEVAWDERKDDILDPATLVKFGKLKAAQILLYGKINVISRTEDRIYAELELHATDIATKQHIWGGNFAYRFYKGKDIQGIVSLDNSLRQLLKKNFEQAKASLSAPEYASRLSGVKTATVIPLSGDIDSYLTGLAIEMLTQTSHTPKNPAIPSLSQVRSFIRDGQLQSDAIFYGAVRDLSRKATPALDTRTEKAFEVNADIQLFLENVKTGEILWSKTITISAPEMEKKVLTGREKMEAATLDSLESKSNYIFWFIGGIVALVVIGILIAIVRSATNVR